MRLEGKIGFDSANSELLSKAIEKGDTKAQALYYVERLKNATALLKDKKNTTQAEDENVLKYMEDPSRTKSASLWSTTATRRPSWPAGKAPAVTSAW